MTDDLFDPTDARLAHDPERDPVLGALLREDRLRERISIAARRRGMRRVDTPWYGWVARYGRAAIPIGIAAALIAAVILNRSVRTEAELAAQAAATDLRGAVADGSRAALTDAVVGPDSTEFFIAMAVDR
ncbi:MAG: hypothetical protein H3C62_01710 [Gemmatimonadaceae bacterium]|nr:hypothetical protein [Gemmatimonadaceae bacterium]